MVQVTLLSFLLSMAVASVICCFMGFDVMEGMMIGAMVAGTGAGVVIPFLRQLRVSEYTKIVLTMESAISEVVSIVVAMSLMDAYQIGNMKVGGVLGNVLASLIMATLIGMLCGILWSNLLVSIRKIKSSMFLTPAFVFIVYGITDTLGFSAPIAVLVFGIVLGNTDFFRSHAGKMAAPRPQPLQDNEKSFFKELVFIFKTYFFVYIGICIPFTNVEALMYGLIITAALFLVRHLLLLVVGRKNTRNDRRVVSMMIPKGLATALMASMPEQITRPRGAHHPPCHDDKYVAYAVIFFSVLGTSLLVFLSRKRLVKTKRRASIYRPACSAR